MVLLKDWMMLVLLDLEEACPRWSGHPLRKSLAMVLAPVVVVAALPHDEDERPRCECDGVLAGAFWSGGSVAFLVVLRGCWSNGMEVVS